MPVVALSRRLHVPEWPMKPRLSTIPQSPRSSIKLLVPAPPRKTTKRPVNTALHQAVLDERIKQVKLLVLKHGADINSVDVFGRTPLMLTCMLNNELVAFKMLKLFMDHGASFNNRDVMGRTVLSYACMKGKTNFVKRIIEEDIYGVNEPDNDGCTPLHHSAVQGNADIMKMLVDKVVQFSLDIDKKDKLGYSAFLLACKHGWYRSAMILLEEGFASPCTRDNEYFYNATQWINASRPPFVDPQAQFLSQRSKTTTAIVNSAMAFDRSSGKSAIYKRNKFMHSSCKHARCEPDPFSSTDIDLPQLSKHKKRDYLAEELSAKHELLYRIQDLFPSEKERPLTAIYHKNKPSTAKLLSLRRDGGNLHSGSETIGTLLRFYANHYDEMKPSKGRPVTVSLGEKAFRK